MHSLIVPLRFWNVVLQIESLRLGWHLSQSLNLFILGLECIVDHAQQLHNLCGWLRALAFQMHVVCFSKFGKLWLRNDMHNEIIKFFLTFDLILVLWWRGVLKELLASIFLLVSLNYIYLLWEIILQSKVIFSQSIIFFLYLQMQLYLLLRVLVTSHQLNLESQSLVFWLKVSVCFDELLQRVDDFGHFIFSLLNLLLQLLDLLPLYFIILFYELYWGLHLLHLLPCSLAVLLRLLLDLAQDLNLLLHLGKLDFLLIDVINQFLLQFSISVLVLVNFLFLWLNSDFIKLLLVLECLLQILQVLIQIKNFLFVLCSYFLLLFNFI